MNKGNLTEGPIAKPLVVFMLPLLLSNILQQLYNMADTIIVGRFAGIEALAGVGAGYSLSNVYITVALGLGIGASVLAGQYFGAGRYDDMKRTISTSLLTFVLSAVVLMTLSLVFLRQILTALRVPSDAFESAYDYMKIILLGLPFVFAYNDIASTFNALGKSKYPLAFLVVSVFFNVILDLLFVVRFSMGAFGAALATVIAQGISAALSFVLLLVELAHYQGQGRTRIFDASLVRKILNLAIPSMVCNTVISFGMMVVQAAVNVFGSEYLAGYAAAMRIDGITAAPYVAISSALSAFVAQNIGAKKYDRIPKALHISTAIMVGFTVVLGGSVILFKRQMIGAFLGGTVSEIAMFVGCGYAGFCSWFFVLLGLKIVFDGILRGAGDMKLFMIANVVNLAIRISVSYALSPIYGVQVIWYAVPIGWAACVIMEGIRVASGKWKTIKAM
ncbi:MAG: MATE family efflux transporter [Sphaerochaetaceae bacterium]|nr:MATE family efflux transporter [Sphaerochaetaceae bacterium]